MLNKSQIFNVLDIELDGLNIDEKLLNEIAFKLADAQYNHKFSNIQELLERVTLQSKKNIHELIESQPYDVLEIIENELDNARFPKLINVDTLNKLNGYLKKEWGDDWFEEMKNIIPIMLSYLDSNEIDLLKDLIKGK